MQFLPQIELPEFIRHVDNCSGGVWLIDDEGNHMELHDQVARYLLCFAVMKPGYLQHCRIQCDIPKEQEYLEKYYKPE